MTTSRSKSYKCAKCGRRFFPPTIWHCWYSKKGAMICFWCCKKCPHMTWAEEITGCIKCGYKKPKGEKNESENAVFQDGKGKANDPR